MSLVDCSMQKGKTGETPDEIVEKAGISKRRFRDWRDRGLVPRPKERPGRGHARGRAAYYPEGTADLCQAIAEKMEHPDVYKLSDAALWLWMEGYPLTDYVREKLLEGLQEKSQEAEEYREEWEEKLATGEPLSEGHPVRRAQYGRPNMGWLNQPLTPGERSTVAYWFLNILTGQETETDFGSEVGARDEESMAPVEKAFAAAVSSWPDWLEEMAEEDELISRAEEPTAHYSAGELRETVREMSTQELESFRDRAVEVISRWKPDELPITEVGAAVLANLLLFQTLGMPIVEVVEHLLAHDDPRAKEIGELFRDELLGLGPLQG